MTEPHRPKHPVDYIPDNPLAREKRRADRRKRLAEIYDAVLIHVLAILFVAAGLYIFARVVAGV